MQSQSQLPKVSTRLGLVWLDSQFGSGSFGESLGSAWARFFSENESLGSASKTNSRLGIKSSASFTSLHGTLRYLF